MNADVNSQSGSAKPGIIILVCLLVLGGLAFGAYKFYGKGSTPGPLSTEEARDAVLSYLKKKAHRSDFKGSMDTVKGDKRPWETLIKRYDSVGDYETVYRLIGEHLWIADNLLRSSDQKELRAGKRLVMELSDVAQDVAVDDWLACRICEGYLVPLFKNDSKLSDEDEQLIHFVGRKYASAEEKQSEIDLEKFYLSKTDSGRRSDWVRYRLVRLLKDTGQPEEAEKVAQQIGKGGTTTTNMPAKKLEKLQKLTNSAAAKI
jgi:hypothetical protein